MNKDIWMELAGIREVFNNYPTHRMVSVDSRGGYIVEESDKDFEELEDEYYDAYCRIGSAKYTDE